MRCAIRIQLQLQRLQTKTEVGPDGELILSGEGGEIQGRRAMPSSPPMKALSINLKNVEEAGNYFPLAAASANTLIESTSSMVDYKPVMDDWE